MTAVVLFPLFLLLPPFLLFCVLCELGFARVYLVKEVVVSKGGVYAGRIVWGLRWMDGWRMERKEGR